MSTSRCLRVICCASVAGTIAIGLAAGGCQRTAPPPEVLPEPAGVAASQGTHHDRVVVTWEAVAGADTYQVERADAEHGPYVLLTSTSETVLEDAELTQGAVYWYRVRACAGTVCGPRSPPVSGYAEAIDCGFCDPYDLMASQGEYPDRIVITWGAMSEATHYRLYRAPEVRGPFEEIAAPSEPRFEDIDRQGNRLTECRGYWYRLSACRDDECTDLSDGVEGWRAARVEGVPVGLSASDRTYPDRVSLSWQPVAGAVTYVVYRDATDNEIARSAEPAYDDVHDPTDNPLQADRMYRYWVQACGEGACGCSARSQHVEGRASALPGTPTGLSAERVDSRVVLTWSAGASIEAPTHHRVDRAVDGGAFAPLGEVAYPTVTYTDAAVASGSRYSYRVVALNAVGASDPTEERTIEIP